MSFQLYLIRHAQSANNALPESQRIEDPGITELGVRQAQHLADRLRGIRFTQFWTSGFRRALQTTRPLVNALGIQPLVQVGIHEVGGCYTGYLPGQLEGRPGLNRHALSEEFPEFLLSKDIDEHGWWKSKPYESEAAARERAAVQADFLFEQFFGTDAVVGCVIHADFKALLLLQMLVERHHQEIRSADLVNTGVTLLEFGSKMPSMPLFNDASHLPRELVSS